jgi:hypothetical protein
MIKDFKDILKKHLTPAGIVEKERIIDLLLEFFDDKILDCTLGVNLDIVNYLGAGKSAEGRPDAARVPAQQAKQRPGKFVQSTSQPAATKKQHK